MSIRLGHEMKQIMSETLGKDRAHLFLSDKRNPQKYVSCITVPNEATQLNRRYMCNIYNKLRTPLFITRN